jgi:hypothetical protein
MPKQVDRQPVTTKTPERPEHFPGESIDSKVDASAPAIQQAIQEGTEAGLAHRRAMMAQVMAAIRQESPERARQAQTVGTDRPPPPGRGTTARL